MVDEHESELIQPSERARDRSLANQLDGIEEPSEDHDRWTLPTVVFEVHATPVARVRRRWHRPLPSEQVSGHGKHRGRKPVT